MANLNGEGNMMTSSPQIKHPQDNATRSFAQASKIVPDQETFPTVDQGVLISAIQGTRMREYMFAVEKATGIGSVLAAHRIQGNRIAMYVSTTDLVDILTGSDTGISIGNNRLHIIPEKARTKKIILSNISPTIPHQAIEEALRNLNIDIASRVTTMYLNLNREGYGVASGRRYVHIKEENSLKLPETIKVAHQGVQFMISTVVDNFTCHKCGKEGHLARNCPDSDGEGQQRTQGHSQFKAINPQAQAVGTEETAKSIIPENTQINTEEDRDTELEEFNLTQLTQEPMDESQKDLKRALSGSSPDTTHSPNTKSEGEGKFEMPKLFKKNKKAKTKAARLLTPEYMRNSSKRLARELRNKPEEYCLTYDEVLRFVNDSYETKDVRHLATIWKLEPLALGKSLKDMHTFVDDITFKGRLTKLSNKLNIVSSDLEEDGYLTASSVNSQP